MSREADTSLIVEAVLYGWVKTGRAQSVHDIATSTGMTAHRVRQLLRDRPSSVRSAGWESESGRTVPVYMPTEDTVRAEIRMLARMVAPDEPTEQCKCGNPARPPHTCPYREDINNDDTTLCTCCASCERECAADI